MSRDFWVAFACGCISVLILSTINLFVGITSGFLTMFLVAALLDRRADR